MLNCCLRELRELGHIACSVDVAHVLDGLGAVCYGCHDLIGMGDSWLYDLLMTGLCENSTLTGLRTNYAVPIFKYSAEGFS